MNATIFYSENGELSLPEEPRRDGLKYKPVLAGEPLCVEICRVALGNTDDWMGDNEILASTWAKTGGDARPAPRVLNFYRDKLKPFESISNLGAEQFGHNLIFYTPAYSGETLRMTVEVLEVDQASDDIVTFTKAVCNSLTSLPFFANQLPVLGGLSVLPKIAEIGLGLYNLINKNDLLLKADLDLSYQRPYQTPLNPGRYVFVLSTVAAASFIRQYRLSPANTLIDAEGREAGRKGGLELPYVVIQISAEPRKEYARFQAISQQQEYMGGILSRLDQKLLPQLAGILHPISELATQGQLLGNIMRLKKELDEVSDPQLKSKLSKLLSGELSKFGDSDIQTVLRAALQGDAVGTLLERAKDARQKTTRQGTAARTNKMLQVRQAIEATHAPFTVTELLAACPEVSLVWVRRLLTRLKKEGLIQPLDKGCNARWMKCAQKTGSSGSSNPVLLNDVR